MTLTSLGEPYSPKVIDPQLASLSINKQAKEGTKTEKDFSEGLIFFGNGPDPHLHIPQNKDGSDWEIGRLLHNLAIDCRKMIHGALQKAKLNKKPKSPFVRSSSSLAPSNLAGMCGFAVDCVNHYFKQKLKTSENQIILHQAATIFPKCSDAVHTFAIISLGKQGDYLIDLTFRQFFGCLWLTPQEASICKKLLRKGFIKINASVMSVYQRVLALSATLSNLNSAQLCKEALQDLFKKQVVWRKRYAEPWPIEPKKLLTPTHQEDFSFEELCEYAGFIAWTDKDEKAPS